MDRKSPETIINENWEECRRRASRPENSVWADADGYLSIRWNGKEAHRVVKHDHHSARLAEGGPSEAMAKMNSLIEREVPLLARAVLGEITSDDDLIEYGAISIKYYIAVATAGRSQ